ncbi:MAG TPA: TIGR01777 family oxidoreductase [Mycobacteriales bacterium]|nr:TIGR01777 family oxidoreductase [Mycobacteriales bacterium]
MQVGITGSSGFLGTALAGRLREQGHDVVRFVRRGTRAADERSWTGTDLAPDALGGLDALVHLSGAGVGDKRWSPAYREVIRRSRVETTAAVARAVAGAGTPVLLSGSAIGFYGDRGAEELHETSGPGQGFLSEVCVAWEAAAAAARGHTRLALLRTGVVVGAVDGELDPLLKRLVPLVKSFLGAPVGNGEQYLSWIALDDWTTAVLHLLTSSVEGPVNLVAPAPVTNAELTRALGRALHRPTLPIGVPGPLVRLVAGGLADEALGSQRVLPSVLLAEGFAFRHTGIDSALAAAL